MRIKYNIYAVADFVANNPGLSSSQIHKGLNSGLGYATIKRLLNELIEKDFLTTKGNAKATKYFIAAIYELSRPIDPAEYFKKEQDLRSVRKIFNHSLIKETLNGTTLFSPEELQTLTESQNFYSHKISKLSENNFRNDLEHLAIDLSWKSSEIEGNTYSLLETERLLKEKKTADGKTKDEAVMLLNHKEAIDFIANNTDYIHPLSLNRIEDLHSILIKELGVDRNIRKRMVSISGTNYRPLDNEFQIKEAMEEMCALINLKTNAFEKALLALILISYIQPFDDGNKRTARIISNALLMYHKHCPLSFRTVDSLDYKKAILIFYEQNNLSAIKRIFMEQFKFAVETYF